MPDTITTPEGVAFRPNLLATTSFDGSIATTYKRTVTDTMCDNTRELALSESTRSPPDPPASLLRVVVLGGRVARGLRSRAVRLRHGAEAPCYRAAPEGRPG